VESKYASTEAVVGWVLFSAIVRFGKVQLAADPDPKKK